MNESKTIKEPKIKSKESDDLSVDLLQDNLHTYEQMIAKIEGKKVMFIDLETTGFPLRKDKSMPGKYANYTMDDQYNTSRILQIGWYYNKNWSKGTFKDQELNVNDVKSVIRKPLNFNSMNPKSLEVHGITIEMAIEHGTRFRQILDGEFGKNLKECDFIIAYNAYFDFSILCNEIHRIKNIALYDKMLRLRDQNVLCMMIMCKSYNGKILSQEAMYKQLFQVEPLKQHDAKNDVFTMLKILGYICKNPKIEKYEIDDNKLSLLSSKERMEEISEINRKIEIIEAVQKKTNGLIQGLKVHVEKLQNNKEIYENNEKDNTGLNSGSLWNQEEEKQLKKMYIDQNMSIKSIAQTHQRTCGGIRARLKKMNLLKEPNQCQYKEDKDQEDENQNEDQEEENIVMPLRKLF